jgi:hypothetical protein
MKEVTKKIRQELDTLIKNGGELTQILGKDRIKFMSEYHEWYTRSLAVVRYLLPDRLAEFERLYHLDKRKGIDASTYAIEDYLQGLSVTRGLQELNVDAIASSKLVNQVLILSSAASRLDDILANIRGILQTDLFDSEIDAARDLKKNGHLRAAGVVVGVILESHLAKVCQNHGVTVRKKNPNISYFNDLLKSWDIFDIPRWRWLQRLGDLRNLCCHSKDREPTPDEVQELIDGVDKAIKTIA